MYAYVLSGYCSTAYWTGSPMRSEFTRVISTACDRDQLAYCSHSKAHNFAQESSIEKIKAPFWSAINLLSGGILISVSLTCGVSPIYAEPVTIMVGNNIVYQLTIPKWPIRTSPITHLPLTPSVAMATTLVSTSYHCLQTDVQCTRFSFTRPYKKTAKTWSGNEASWKLVLRISVHFEHFSSAIWQLQHLSFLLPSFNSNVTPPTLADNYLITLLLLFRGNWNCLYRQIHN